MLLAISCQCFGQGGSGKLLDAKKKLRAAAAASLEVVESAKKEMEAGPQLKQYEEMEFDEVALKILLTKGRAAHIEKLDKAVAEVEYLIKAVEHRAKDKVKSKEGSGEVIERMGGLRERTDELRKALKEYMVLANQKSPQLPELRMGMLSVSESGVANNLCRVIQKISNIEVIAEREFPGGSQTIWLVGDFSKASDGEKVEMKGVYVVETTKTYKTVLGASNTIVLLRPVKFNR